MKYYEDIFNSNDSEIPVKIFESDAVIVDDELAKDDTSNSNTTAPTKEAAVVNDEGGSGWGYIIGGLSGSALSTFGMSAIGYWFLKRSIVKGVTSNIGSIVSDVVLANPGITNGLVASKQAGIFSKFIGSIKGGFGSLFGQSATTTGTQLTLFNSTGTAAAGNGGFLSSAGGLMKAAGAKITAVITSTTFLVVVAVGVAIWATFYLLGDLSMYEILEIWKTGKHGDPPKDDDKDYGKISTDVYKGAGSGLLAAKITGLKFLQQLNAKYSEQGKVTIRLRDSKKIVNANAEEYLKLYEILSTNLEDVPLITEMFAGKDEKEWIAKVKENYTGLPVSGRKDVANYDIMKSYVTKYMLEDEDNPNNHYKSSVAEEAEGWYSTFFGNFTPGMNALGWSSWMLSEEYLNNVNSVVPLKSREWLFNAVNSYWIAKVSNLDASSFTIEQFASMSEHILKDGAVKANIDVLKNLEFGVVNDNAEYKRLGTLQDLLRVGGKFVTDMLLNTAKGEKKVPVTNVTMSFALMYVSYTILYLMYEGLVIQLSLLQVALGLDDGEKKVLNKYGVKDEVDSGVRSDGGKKPKDVAKETTTKSTAPKVLPIKEIIKSADEVIETFKTLPNINDFEG